MSALGEFLVRNQHYAQALQLALENVGSEEVLASTLDVAPELLDIWLAGRAVPPYEIYADALVLGQRTEKGA
jgi:hypothetical protein